MADEKQVTHRAPERLINWLHRPGYEVELLVSRVDGEALSDDDRARLEASLKAYDVADKEDGGPAFVAPAGDA